MATSITRRAALAAVPAVVLAPPVHSDEWRRLMLNYHTWLVMEAEHLEAELGIRDVVFMDNPASVFHWVSYGDPPKPAPSTRAIQILKAAGCSLV